MHSSDYLENYYERGYIKTKIDNEIKIRLWNEIYSTDWIGDKKEGIYKSIPSWYQTDKEYLKLIDGSNRADFEREIGKELRHKTPQSLIQIGHDLLKTNPFSFFKIFYRDADLRFIDMWNGSEEIDFHFDTINGCDTLVLIYLTEQLNWSEEWGGYIEMKKRVGDIEVFKEKVLPSNGTMLIINNANPLIYHRVHSLKNKDVNRYTFSFIYKWS